MHPSIRPHRHRAVGGQVAAAFARRHRWLVAPHRSQPVDQLSYVLVACLLAGRAAHAMACRTPVVTVHMRTGHAAPISNASVVPLYKSGSAFSLLALLYTPYNQIIYPPRDKTMSSGWILSCPPAV
ncbi:hypothetical protein BS78_04G129200 [Paspalum vaginatum]|nr:hypothetical protein BS78_04G129200 [Paspalum vaginatum]